MNIVADIIGLIGVVIILVTYALLQLNRMDHSKFLYSFLNFIGAILITFSLYFHWNTPSVIIEIAWIIISIYGMYKSFMNMKKM